MSDHPTVARVKAAAMASGHDIDVVTFPEGTRTAVDAAAALECDVEQIVKSLIFNADGELVLALTSGANQVDTDKLAIAAERPSCGRADADQVRATTGYAIGGVPPFGHDQPVRTWIDPHLLTMDEVWAAAGTPKTVFAIDPNELVKITGADVFDFTA